MNLIEGLQKEMNRCRELLKQYEAVGPVGAFAKNMIQGDIRRAEDTIAHGDTVEMLAAYKQLQGCK